ncbi:MAG TPA: 3-oxoacid CoA-transferase subunit B [Clostridia bacterium]|nr:3-oxoacid CoA-transferase subunit B [Clostridia bacterium]
MQTIPEQQAKERIASVIARHFDAEAQSGRLFINLGVGIPTVVANYVTNPHVYIQAENGMLGVGCAAPEGQMDHDLINAGRTCVTETPGCSYLDSAASFGMIRGGHVDATVIGAFEVDQTANIANWIIPNGKQLGVGGAMDLVTGAREVVIAMQHTSKNGKAKLVRQCTLPVTGIGEADMVVTEYAVFLFDDGRLVLRELAPEITVDELRAITEAEFEVSPELRTMAV